ncbi:MAG: hypothetical protein ATN35_01230 [Epulopiscium sp. Nele67-Bin004]|nr:MAG: hypothetical protein ATN35_01230 [Epulopiscium sp. Nele67-Bin004]
MAVENKFKKLKIAYDENVGLPIFLYDGSFYTDILFRLYAKYPTLKAETANPAYDFIMQNPNYAELKEAIEKEGITFRTETDSNSESQFEIKSEIRGLKFLLDFFEKGPNVYENFDIKKYVRRWQDIKGVARREIALESSINWTKLLQYKVDLLLYYGLEYESDVLYAAIKGVEESV